MQRVAELSKEYRVRAHSETIAFVAMACALVIAPVFAYPVFLMKALCFALFVGWIGCWVEGSEIDCGGGAGSVDGLRGIC